MPSRARALSRRNVRGRGWHKEGYRENGRLFFQLKRSYSDFSREHEVNENETITTLLNNMLWDVHAEDSGPLSHLGLHYEFYCQRTRLEPSGDMVRKIMNGGKVVYAKIFGNEGTEYNYDGYELVPKQRQGRRAQVQDFADY